MKAKEKLESVKMYGRKVSEFLLPDQMQFIEKAMEEYALTQVKENSDCINKPYFRVYYASRELGSGFVDYNAKDPNDAMIKFKDDPQNCLTKNITSIRYVC